MTAAAKGKATRTLKVYLAKDGYRWHLTYGGKIVSESGEAYKRRPTAVGAARTYGVPAGDFPVVLVYEQYRGSKLTWVKEQIRG